MKITLPARSLKALLDGALRLGTGDATHPGFGLMHIEATKKGALRATVINAQAAVRTVRTDVQEGFVPGVVALGLRLAEDMASVMGSAGDTDVNLTLVDNGPGRQATLRVKGERLLMKIPTQPLENLVPFPTPPGGDAVTWTNVDGAMITSIVRQALWCTAPPSDVARPNLQGLHATPKFVEASDGHRLVRFDVDGFVNGDVLMPAVAVSSMASYIGDAKARIAIESNRVWMQSSSCMFTCRLLDGKFPDVDAMGMFIRPDTQGNAMANNRQMVPVFAADISQPSMVIAAENMTKVFKSGGKDDRPVLRFLIRDGHMNVTMKSETGESIDIAHQVDWRPSEQYKPTEDGIKELQLILLDAQYVAQVLTHMPKSDFVQMFWISALNRVQFQVGPVMSVLMPRRHE